MSHAYGSQLFRPGDPAAEQDFAAPGAEQPHLAIVDEIDGWLDELIRASGAVVSSYCLSLAEVLHHGG